MTCNVVKESRFFEVIKRPLNFIDISERITADTVYGAMGQLKQEHKIRDKRIKTCYNVLYRKNPMWSKKEILQEIADCTGWKYGTIKKIIEANKHQ